MKKTWIMQRMAATGIPDSEIAFATAGTWLAETFPDLDHGYPAAAPEVFRTQMEEIGADVRHSTDGGIGVCSRMGEEGFYIAAYQESDAGTPEATTPIIRVRSIEEGRAIADQLAEIIDFIGLVSAFNCEIESPEHGEWMDVMGHVASEFGSAARRAIVHREMKPGAFCVRDALWLKGRYRSISEQSPAGVLIAELAEHALYEFKRATEESVVVQHAMVHAGRFRASIENECPQATREAFLDVITHIEKHKPQLRRDVVPVRLSGPRKERPRPVAGWQYVPGLQGVESEYCRILFFRDGEVQPEVGELVNVGGANGTQWRAWLDKDHLAGVMLDRDERKMALLHAANTFLYHTWTPGA